MVSLTTVDVSATANADATRLVRQRKMFRNPRGNENYYIFYSKNVGGTDTIYYGWTSDLTSWPGVQVDIQALTTTSVKNAMVAFVEDAGNAQTIVYLAAEDDGDSGEVRIRRGTIQDADAGDLDDIITWDAEEQLYDNTYDAGRFSIAIDPNGYLWASNVLVEGGQGTNVKAKATQGTLPAAPLSFGTELRWENFLNVNTTVNIMPYTAAQGIATIAFTSRQLLAAILTWGGGAGSPTIAIGPTLDIQRKFSGAYNPGPIVKDDNDLIHVCYGHYTVAAQVTYYHQSYTPSTTTWSGQSTVYGGIDNTYDAPLLVRDTSQTPNVLFAVYEHGTGQVEYKTTPANAVSWSAATEIENHAEDIRYIIGWFEDDPSISGNVFGAYLTLTTNTVRSFLIDFSITGVITDVKRKGWWVGKRGKKFFLDGDTFVGQDNHRWDYQDLAGDTDATNFAWSTQGQATVPADRQMTGKETYAYAMLVAVVQSADMSDCKIGFYADTSHYAWIDQDSLRVRNGITSEQTVDVSAVLADSTLLKIILIWTPLYIRLIVVNISTGARTAFIRYNPPQIESNVTFQVISSGSSLLVEDYVLLDAENDVLYEDFIDYMIDNAAPLPTGAATESTLGSANTALQNIEANLGPYSKLMGFDKTIGSATVETINSNIACKTVTVQSAYRNTKSIWLGGSVMGTMRRSVELRPGDNLPFVVNNASQVYGVAEGSNQILHCVYTV